MEYDATLLSQRGDGIDVCADSAREALKQDAAARLAVVKCEEAPSPFVQDESSGVRIRAGLGEFDRRLAPS